MQGQQVDPPIHGFEVYAAKLIVSLVLATALVAAGRYLLAGRRRLGPFCRFLFNAMFGVSAIGMMYVGFVLDVTPPAEQVVFGPFVVASLLASVVLGGGAALAAASRR